MYYSNGNYEAFARPEKPEGVDRKSAYLVGSGLASLAAACFLVRDGQMKGEHIHILEELALPGGACDGINDPQRGFIIRGGREMENHFECLWDLFRSIPSVWNSYVRNKRCLHALPHCIPPHAYHGTPSGYTPRFPQDMPCSLPLHEHFLRIGL